ncbi:acyltransferase domain-containing protein [Streptomyces phaeofaciens]|uniref:acyltransferase domain-containing protein n=1 Tax=Streptomyces phaeofaciens TaxID=68254 RepID=UPI0036C9320B
MLADGAAAPHLVLGAAHDSARPVFVFPGQGPQWPAMARELQASSPVFRRTLAECAEALEPYTDWSLEAVLTTDQDPAVWTRPDVTQPPGPRGRNAHRAPCAPQPGSGARRRHRRARPARGAGRRTATGNGCGEGGLRLLGRQRGRAVGHDAAWSAADRSGW